jgi:hypothetical protein
MSSAFLMLSVIVLRVVILSVAVLGVVMLSDVAPSKITVLSFLFESVITRLPG